MDARNSKSSTAAISSSPSVTSLNHAGEACRKIIESAQSAEPLMQHQWARHRLIDFNHWAAGVGLFAKSKNSLDWRLREHQEAIRVVVSVLNMLCVVFERLVRLCKSLQFSKSTSTVTANLTPTGNPQEGGPSSSVTETEVLNEKSDSFAPVTLSFSPWSSDEEGENSDNDEDSSDARYMLPSIVESCKDAENLIDRLIDLGFLIRRSGLSSRLLKADMTFREELYPRLRKLLRFRLSLSNVRATNTIDECRLFQGSASTMESVSASVLRSDQIRLIYANLRRRHWFAFARRRALALANTATTAAPAPLRVIPAVQAMQTQVSEEIADDLRSSELPSLDEPQSAARSTAIPSQISASGVNQGFDLRLPEDLADVTNQIIAAPTSTQLSTTIGKLHYPKAPKMSSQRAFQCPCCYQILPKRIGTNPKSWRKHLARDLFPYTCPIVGCSSVSMLFVKKKEWRSHLEDTHMLPSHWVCSICTTENHFFDRRAFKTHVSTMHGPTIVHNHLEAMIGISERRSIDVPDACPVCNLDRSSLVLDDFLNHLAECIHQFSLEALPWNDTDFSGPAPPGVEILEKTQAWLSSCIEDTGESQIFGSSEGSTDTLESTPFPAPISDLEDEGPAEESFPAPMSDLEDEGPAEELFPDDQYFNLAAEHSDTLDNVERSTVANEGSSDRDLSDSLPFPESDTGIEDSTKVDTDTEVHMNRPSLDSSPPSSKIARRGSSSQSRETDDSERAGRVWAREIDDAWWPCILTLDGGGIRGYSALLILKELMHQIWIWENILDDEEQFKPGLADDALEQLKTIWIEDELLPCHYFDFMYGTSSGGLISTMLGRLRMTVPEALNSFQFFGDVLFGRRRSQLPLTVKYYHEPLERGLRDLISSRCHQHEVCAGEDLHPWEFDHSSDHLASMPFNVDDPRVCQSCCLAAANDGGILRDSFLLRTYPLYYSEDSPNWVTRYSEGAVPLPIWKVVRATMATPFYFQTVEAEVDGVQMVFKDGGIRENNPSGAALNEFHILYNGKASEPALLLSIGSGRPDSSSEVIDSPPIGRLKRIIPLMGSVFNSFLSKRSVIQNVLVKYTEGEKQHLSIRDYARGEYTWYKRLNVGSGLGNMAMDEWTFGEWKEQKVAGGSTLARIERATSTYLDREFDPSIDTYASPSLMIKQTAEKLVRQRRARERMGGIRWTEFVKEQKRNH